MKKYSKILLLLPFLSIAMPGKNDSRDGEMSTATSTLAQLAQPPVSITFDIWRLATEFAGHLTSVKMLFTNRYFFNSINRDQIEKMDESSVISHQVYISMLALYHELRLRPTDAYLPAYISICGQLPKRAKERLTSLIKEGVYDRQIYCGQFGTKTEIPVVENMLEEPKSENYWKNMLNLGCVQELIKKVNFRKDLSEDAIISIAKKIASKFEYVTDKMLTEGAEENLRFKSELAEKIQNDICFIVKDEYVNFDKSCFGKFERKGASFKNLCGEKIAKVHLLVLVADEMCMYEAPFYPASLSVYALGSFNIRDSNLKHLQFIKWENPLIDAAFLFCCTGLTSLNFSSFSQITKIGNDFLGGCTGLTSLDLSPLSQVTQIENHFLSECRGLTSVDLSSFNRVTQIESGFLYGCNGLTSVDLSSLNQVTKIENYFLYGCYGLTSVDLSSLNQVTQIKNNFLYECRGLTNVDLSSLKNVTQIGDHFLYECSGLTSVDLSSLNQVTQTGSAFLSNCKKLTSVDLSSLNRVTKIENCFLSECDRLTSVDLSSLKNVTQIGDHFLYGCYRLTSVDLSSLKNVTQIGDHFLSSFGLTSVDLSPLNQVTTIGNKWLEGGWRLKNLNLSKLEHVTQVGSDFLKNCNSLKKENVNTGTLPADHPVVRAVDKALGAQK